MRTSTSARRRLDAAEDVPRLSRAQLQARDHIAELEARLADVTRCLEAAERGREESRVGLVAAEDALRATQLKLERIEATRSWRMTAPLRGAMGRLRRLFRR